MKVEIADSAWKKFKGLMFRKTFEGALVFPLHKETRFGASIHTFFMQFPIDILFLDKDKKVIDLRRDVKPWTLNITPKKPAKYIVELTGGKAGDIGIGHRFLF